MTDILHRVNKLVYTDSAWGNGTVEVVKDQGLQQHKDIHLQVEGEDTATHIHTQPHSDTHIQQEDTTHVYSVEDTHTYTTVDSSVVDTHTTTVPHSDTLPLHSSVVDSILHSTADIDTYIHTAIDTTTLY